MERSARCRILALIGSGETSPTMVTVHRELVARLGVARPRAVLLATPYAFQENAPWVLGGRDLWESRSSWNHGRRIPRSCGKRSAAMLS